MYTSLGKYTYPDGRTYRGPANFCRYTFFASKSFDPQEVNSQVIYNSDQAAIGENAVMLTNKGMIDQSGTNNAYMVDFEAVAPGVSGIASQAGIGYPPWIIAVIAFAIVSVAVAGAYSITQVKEISYSPAGNTFWIVMGITVVGAIYLGTKYFAGKKKVA